MKRIFVCSRLRPWGLSAEKYEGRCIDSTPLLASEGERDIVCGCAGCNVKRAKVLCKRVSDAGHAPYAPHLFCTQFLDDRDEKQRAAGIAIGLAFLQTCDELWYDDRYGLSEGMRAEIKHAESTYDVLTGGLCVTRVRTFAEALP